MTDGHITQIPEHHNYNRKQKQQLARWRNNIIKYLNNNYIQIVRDRNEWERLQETFARYGLRIVRYIYRYN